MAKANPFDKYLKPEDRLQIAIAQFLQLQYPKVVWLHPPNEGKRTPFEQYLYKQLGCLTGASDMIIFEARGEYHGLVIEIKVKYASGKKNYPTERQKDFLRALTAKRWCVAVVWSLEEAIDLINGYMRL